MHVQTPYSTGKAAAIHHPDDLPIGQVRRCDTRLSVPGSTLAVGFDAWLVLAMSLRPL